MTPNHLERLVKENIASIFRFANKIWLADGLGALYLPEIHLLVVSDLHFGKGSFLKMHGHPLPTYDTIATVELIEKLLERYQPITVLCLGDSFHDVRVGERLSNTEAMAIRAMIEQVQQWIWVLGNHDPDIPVGFAGDQVSTWEYEDIVFTHEPVTDLATASYQIMGHFHPKLTHSIKRQQMTGKCFIASTHELIMPSLGVYTGGLPVDDPVYEEVFTTSVNQTVLCYQEKAFLLLLNK